jgi:Trypsin-like peptidase domain
VAAEHWRRAARSVVRVALSGGGGTAFLVEKSGLFLTAYHVVADAYRFGKNLRLIRRPDVDIVGKVVAVDAQRDIALICASLPSGHRLRSAVVALAPKSSKGELITFNMLDPSGGFMEAIESSAEHLGETAVSYKVGDSERLIHSVWSKQGITIPGGTSGAPGFDREMGAVVAVACAGADDVRQVFFVPLSTLSASNDPSPGPHIRSIIEQAASNETRLGALPNERGVRVLSWLATQKAATSFVNSAVYDPLRAIERVSLREAVNRFLDGPHPLALVAGASGMGKSTGVTLLARRNLFRRPAMLIRAARLEIAGGTFRKALERAMGVVDLQKLPSQGSRAPLLVIDGLNELETHAYRRKLVTKGELVEILQILGSRGWKTLITTRSETLHEFRELPDTITLFDPIAGDPDHTGYDTGHIRTPHIRLEGYTRVEFEEIRASNRLPHSFPFDVFRHPFILRLAVKSIGGQIAATNVRGLLAQYVTTVVDRMHAGLAFPANREMIAGRLEQLTAKQDESSGFLEISIFDQPADVAIAEVAVAEGLLEHVPGGYRYVYDEIYEYLRARVLQTEIRRSESKPLELLGQLKAHSPSLVARSLEIAGDHDPEWIVRFAGGLSSQLAATKLPIQALWSTQVLGRVEKGLLDDAKDTLPVISGKHDLLDYFYALSESHLSYAFGKDQLWSIVRSSAKRAEDRDSYPFRSKDLLDASAAATAKEYLSEHYEFSALRHLIEISPNDACEYLCENLSDRRRLGSEHSFGDFCAHALAAFLDKFDRSQIIRSAGVFENSGPLFSRITDEAPRATLELLLDGSLGFIGLPDSAARCLNMIVNRHEFLRDRAAEIALRLVVDFDHPVAPFGALLTKAVCGTALSEVVFRMHSLWTAGAMSEGQLVPFQVNGLVSFEQMVSMLAERLKGRRRNFSDEPSHMMDSLSHVLSQIDDVGQRRRKIDLIVEMLLEASTREDDNRAAAVETLLPACVPLGEVPATLHSFMIRLAESEPKGFVTHLKFILFGSFGGQERDFLRREIVEILDTRIADFEFLLPCIRMGAEQAPDSTFLGQVVDGALARFGQTALIDFLDEDVAYYARIGMKPRKDIVKTLAEICVRHGYTDFSRFLGGAAG